MKTLTIPPHLLTLVRDYGHNKAVAWLDGEEELAKPDDDLCSFLSRSDVEFDHLAESDRDALRDEYLETIKLTFAQRLASTVSCHAEGPLGSPKGLRPPQGGNSSCVTDVPPLGEMEESMRGFRFITFRDAYDGVCSIQESSADGRFLWLGQDKVTPKILASKAASVGVITDETTGWVEVPMSPDVMLASRMHLHEGQVRSLIAHLQSWLLTGSFSLTPPVSTQIDSGASLADDRDFIPPSPEKPVVQPTQSDSGGSPKEPSNTSGSNPPHGTDVPPGTGPQDYPSSAFFC
jgi:hypothetical protein